MKTIAETVRNQKAFFDAQKTKDIQVRIGLLKKLKVEILNQEESIYKALNNDFKKSEFESFISEFGLVISELNLVIKNLKQWSKPQKVKSSILTFPSSDYIYKSPYGNVLIIAPWNYPFLLAIEPLVMAVAAGNTVVLKPSELTVHISGLITKIIKNVFPADWVTSIEGGIQTSTELLAQKWDYIFFTGSTKVGKIIAKAAANHLTPATLELGGKSPCIIDETVNVKLIARRLVWGKLLNAGQTCIAPDYVIVKSEIKEALVNTLIQEIERAYGQNPKESLDLPRIINSRNAARLANLLDCTNVIFGGEVDLESCYIAPTIINEPDLNSPIMKEEIFGPILPILTYNTETEIENIIRHSDRPLAFYIFSKDKSFIEKTITKYNFGGGVINDLLVHFGNNKLPFGGIGGSGMGKYHGKHGFDTFSHEKSIIKRGTWVDPSLRYAPYKGKLSLIKRFFKYFT